jgi:hypothetical protein
VLLLHNKLQKTYINSSPNAISFPCCRFPHIKAIIDLIAKIGVDDFHGQKKDAL